MLVSTSQTIVSVLQTLLSQLRPQLSDICPPVIKNDHIEDMHTHTNSLHSRRPGRDKLPGSRERGLNGKKHSFSCCYFQIMAGLFWLLVVLELAPGILTNGDRPGVGVKRTGPLILWDQHRENLKCYVYA